MRNIALLGSTGSIGNNVLEVIRKYPDAYRIVALTAGSNITALAEQTLEFDPEVISIAHEGLVEEFKKLLPTKYHPKILVGNEGNCEAAQLASADMVVSAVVGSVGLLPVLAAIEAGKDIGLANKETLVMAGELVMKKVHQAGVQLLPIDSEHSAIFQALEAGRRQDLFKILLTASGGPFRQLEKRDLFKVSPEQALAHPNWSMGRKISIDSATLMNKGLEVIEAKWLFDVEPDNIEVVVHPQSIVHSLVEYKDGSVIAQLGIPDMQIPIAYAMSYPERRPLKLPRLNLTTCGDLTFESPDLTRFPCLKMAFEALDSGGLMPAALNAANEVAVDAFLDGYIAFMDIPDVVSQALSQTDNGDAMDIDAVLQADTHAREHALAQVEHIRRS